MSASVLMPKGWEDQLLKALGAPTTTADVEFEDAWFDEEHGSSGETGGFDQGGAYNPFDTTLGSPQAGGGAPPGSTVYNSVGVMSYPSWDAGMTETVKTLEEPAYANLVAMIRGGHASLAQLETAEDATPWGTAFPNPSNTPPVVPGNSGKSINAKLTSFPGGPYDPLNWPGDILGAAGKAASAGAKSLLDPIGHMLLELVFVAMGAGLVIVGGFITAGKKPSDALAVLPIGAGAGAAAA
jgi:hypothetical protein